MGRDLRPAWDIATSTVLDTVLGTDTGILSGVNVVRLHAENASGE
uniref:Uncharacterized protein n=1 Tax=Peronospora matthiolae TaxID=2874970 RepID=A0AAV1USC3_9STRA